MYDRFLKALGRPLTPLSRGLVALAALLVVASLFVPLWHMTFVAQQYPEGLDLYIYSYDLVGGDDGNDLTEINVLNHYIGMAELKPADFNELKGALQTTQGNLSVHLRKLEEAGYVEIEKSFLDRKPLTRARLKPVLMSGGYGQFTYAFNYWGPTGVNRDTFVYLRRIERPDYEAKHGPKNGRAGR